MIAFECHRCGARFGCTVYNRGVMTKDEILGLRKSLGESRETFARRIGVTMNTVRRWEKGEVQPSLGYMQRLRRVRGQFLQKAV